MPRPTPHPTPRRALDDPAIATTAWTRFRRLMRWMALWGALCVGAVLGFLYWIETPMPIHMIIATTAGVWCTFMLGTGLMSLAFMSSATGHDEQIDDRLKREAGYDDD